MPQKQLDLFPSLTDAEKIAHGTRIAQMIAARTDIAEIQARNIRHREAQQVRNAARPNRKCGAKHYERQSIVMPFAGVDGEGGGTDEFGRQNYLLLRAGKHELFKNNERLTTEDCLEFLLSLPANYIYVGFYFTYDVTMILRDVPRDYLLKICSRRTLFDNNPKHEYRRKSNYVYWKNYAIDFVPRQHFSVARINSGSNKIVPGSSRTINETAGFFQAPFVKVCEDWQHDIGLSDADFAAIKAGKAQRESFVQIDKAERKYCYLECDTLAAILSKFRDICVDSDLVPTKWRGAGWLASVLHSRNKTPRHIDQWSDRPMQLKIYAQQAYYGGRFEITRVGMIDEIVYEYDINSAYPSAMLELPCPLHTKWHKLKENSDLSACSGVFVAHVLFKGQANRNLYHLPIRTRKGVIIWPATGEGVYWSPELRLAMQDTELHCLGGYHAEKRCDCHVFEWVRELYSLRKTLGKDTRGYPIKLGINALYGKLAQRAGSRAFHDYVAAGLITSITRAKLISAYMQNSDAVLMLATDGVYSTAKLDLSFGNELGQWECKEHSGGMFIVQPGVYWFPGDEAIKPKSRGVPRTRIVEMRADFIRTWLHWIQNPSPDLPSVPVEIQFFCPTRLGLHRLDPYAAGKWDRMVKNIRFDWTSKRSPKITVQGNSILTQPYMQSFVSVFYNPDIVTPSDEHRNMLDMHFEGAPDHNSFIEELRNGMES